MDYKFKALYDKIYRKFIRGEYGNPKIPSENEVILKMEEITTDDYSPITNDSRMSNIDISTIKTKFGNIIDDLDVLFSSVENESVDILDQLTNSLKEHRGVKRELRQINSRADDISNGKLGDDYIEYHFTESFNDVSNINSKRSDPIFSDAGVFSINREKDEVLSLAHYYGTKLEWSISNNHSTIIDHSYVGSTDASVMLDQLDPRQLVYKIITSYPTSLNCSVLFQLLPDGRTTEINGVTLDIDSSISKGWIRLYYKKKHKWEDVKNNSLQEIKSDKIIYNFPNVTTSHIKVEFIKDSPDDSSTNEYYYVINNLAIFRGSSRRSSVLYSNPITFSSYNNEIPVINTIEASSDITIPNNCDAKLYVAQDIELSGQFLDYNNNPVYPESSNAKIFSPSATGTVFLSDIWNAESTVSGIEMYKGMDFNWKPLKVYGTSGQNIPNSIEFDTLQYKPKIDNSIFTITSRYTFGDINYTGIYDISGWVNTSNSSWELMEPLVNSGILVSGVTITGVDWIEDINGNLNPEVYEHPDFSGQWIGRGSGTGYPFSYNIPNHDRTFRFNEYDISIDGWWRPLSDAVTPTGISYEYLLSGKLNPNYLNYLPDYYFNNIAFYKIYKFGIDSDILPSTIKLYSYQERPILGDNDYYPSIFNWRYRSDWLDNIGIKENVRMTPPPDTFDNYIIPVSGILGINEEYIVDSVYEVKVHGTNTILDESEYFTVPVGNKNVTGIDVSKFGENTNYPVSGVAFDYKYKHRVRNEYLSSWSAYAIVLPGAVSPSITIPNQRVSGRDISLIKNISVSNLDQGVDFSIEEQDGIFTIPFDDIDPKAESHFKITIYCASDEETGFCANNWVPITSSNNKTISVTPGIKLVSRLKPITIVSINNLIYDTPIGNDNRASIITEQNGEKYLIVKRPSKDIFPGYYFDSLNKKYLENNPSKIENYGHWIRNGVNISYETIPGYSGQIPVYSDPFIYTTGSNASGIIYNYQRSDVDYLWNDGKVLPNYPNYTGISFYPHHTTYGYPLNINNDNNQTIHLETGDIDPRAPYASSKVGSDDWISWISSNYPTNYTQWLSSKTYDITDTNRGFLFYDTAENLPAFYSIGYKKVTGSLSSNKRFLYKLELVSDDENLVPVVRSLRFTMR